MPVPAEFQHAPAIEAASCFLRLLAAASRPDVGAGRPRSLVQYFLVSIAPFSEGIFDIGPMPQARREACLNRTDWPLPRVISLFSAAENADAR